MPFSKQTHIRIPVLQKILSWAFLLNICAVSAILLAEMDIDTVLVTLVILVFVNTLLTFGALLAMVSYMAKITAQMTKTSETIKQIVTSLDRIEWRN